MDLTARARIRDAAIACFAEHGVAGTSVRAIAKAAGVSAALVIHHFGSKDALRVACDQHVAALVREQKSAAMGEGLGVDPVASLRTYKDGPPLLRYLARTLIDGSPHVAELVDYMEQGVEAGAITPSDDPRARAAVLTVWSLGALVMHEHVARLHRPELLILDEPTSGLDPLLQHEFLALVREAQADGATVFMSSHVLTEVEDVAGRVAIIRAGQIVDTDDVGPCATSRARRSRCASPNRSTSTSSVTCPVSKI